MIHAVFNAEGKPLAQFDDDEHNTDGAILAERALSTTYRALPGAYADVLCVDHRAPKSDCPTCEKMMNCRQCRWPDYACVAHR